MRSISYNIIVHNEGIKYLSHLFSILNIVCRKDDEIVVIDDFSTETTTVEFLSNISTDVKIYKHALNGNFSEHKNFAKSCCTKDVVFNIDADEYLTTDSFNKIQQFIDTRYDEFDVIYLSRFNTLDHVTPEILNTLSAKMSIGLVDSEFKIILSYPDFQGRIFKNTNHIKWVNSVHEHLTGYSKPVYLDGKDFSIIHEKTIIRQEKQQQLYTQIMQNRK